MPKDKKTKLSIVPMFDKVLLMPFSREELVSKSSFGIVIPDTVSKDKPEQGVVVALGSGKYEDGKLIPMTVKEGDRVVFSKYGYDEIKVDGVEYYILSESNILAIIK